jgi:hypothetical protein
MNSTTKIPCAVEATKATSRAARVRPSRRAARSPPADSRAVTGPSWIPAASGDGARGTRAISTAAPAKVSASATTIA